MAQLRLALLIVTGTTSPVLSATLEQDSHKLRGSSAPRLAPAASQVAPLSVPDGGTPIHLLISAFQDGERCANTVFRALLQAKHPERLSFNVLQAAGSGEVDCLEEFRSRHLPKICHGKACDQDLLSRVHFWKIPSERGEGPVHQRGLLSELADLSGQGSMCLSIDSHMDFTKDWDRNLIQDWHATDNEFAVLTAYPLDTSEANLAYKGSWISLCGYFLSDGIPRGADAEQMDPQEGMKPVLTMNWAAGQSFSRCHAEKNVPVDKHLVWIFDGEEVNRAVRLWTHGYDLYNPRVSVVLHNYSHPLRTFWSYGPPTEEADKQASRSRLEKLLQGSATREEFGHFGLGDQRSLEQYVTWSHTNLGGQWGAFLQSKGIQPLFPDSSSEAGTVSSFCDGLQRVPVRSTQALLASIAA